MRVFVGIGARSGFSTHNDGYIPINAHLPVPLFGAESLAVPNMSSTVWVGLCAAGVAIATLGYVLFGPELWRSKGRALRQAYALRAGPYAPRVGSVLCKWTRGLVLQLAAPDW